MQVCSSSWLTNTERAEGSLDMALCKLFVWKPHARQSCMRALLLQGCVLEEYSAGVEEKLRALELESIQDYIAESDNLVDLHQQVNRTVHMPAARVRCCSVHAAAGQQGAGAAACGHDSYCAACSPGRVRAWPAAVRRALGSVCGAVRAPEVVWICCFALIMSLSLLQRMQMSTSSTLPKGVSASVC